jgi:ankyrin repeat protein
LIACDNGHADIARLLVARGANVNARTVTNFTCLFLACDKGHTEIARLLIERGANVNARTNSGTTPLHLSFRIHTEIVRLLLERGADPRARDTEGKRPVDYASDYAPARDLVRILSLALRHDAARLIQTRWRFVIAYPKTEMWRRRMQREFGEFSTMRRARRRERN